MKNSTELTVEFCHPDATEDPVFALVNLSWTYENDTYELPGSFAWDYIVQHFVDLEGNPVNRPAWLKDSMMDKEIQRELEFLDLEN